MIPDWDRLRGECSAYQEAHYAESTKRTRSVQVRAYLEFCEIFGDRLMPYPCDADQVCLYMSFLARRLCFNSIKQYLSALNNHLKDVGASPIPYGDHGIKKCMAGIRRVLGDSTKQAPPLLPAQLLRLFTYMYLTGGHIALRAAMLLSFRALLRKCHVTNSESTLLRSDFTFSRWGMIVRVRRSKTIQFRERVHTIPVACVANPALCAVYWVQRHFRDAPGGEGDHAFLIRSRGRLVSMPYTFYLSSIKYLSDRARLHPGNFSTHSLRRGGATFLRLCGATILEIKERGDWRSDAVFEYLKASLPERLALDLRVSAILANENLR